MSGRQPRVICGLATYRQDRAVLELAARAASPRGREIFAGALIVDSLGSGELPAALEERGLAPFVRYHGFGHNLGAAGNLHFRLLLAAGLRGDYLFALNHDGDLDLDAVRALVACARDGEFGAVYPLRRMAPDLYDLTGTSSFPLRPRRMPRRRLPAGGTLPVHWSSSNGALYSLRPTRAGLRPPVGLWMGFEDFGWSLTLSTAGYRQVVCLGAELGSGYDYRARHLLGARRYLADKPPWLSYYLARNLLLLATRYFPSPRRFLFALARIGREALVSLALRPRPLARLRLLARGVVDGLRGRSGLVVEPEE